ncbi:MAG: FAD:protein FMN transferase [Porticoccaceae bacterium]|nr:MAG: FAD:protein FMN transferase [Porticoccaceae bacterium]
MPGDLDAQIREVLDQVDRRMSTYRQDSELQHLNRAPPGRAVTVSPQLAAVLAVSQRVWRLTEGAFDPTVGPLVDLWGFGPGARTAPPAEAEVERLRAEVGFGAVALDLRAGTVVKARGVALDLSAVAKGYAVDRVSERLAALGLGDHLVEVGGELVARGKSPRGTPWRIAIERPEPGARVAARVIQVSDAAVATSGDYRNFIERDGRRYSHVIDPRTGRPARSDIASITVVAPDCATADALATGLMVLGSKKALALAEREGLAVHLFRHRAAGGFEARHSPAFAPYLAGGAG